MSPSLALEFTQRKPMSYWDTARVIMSTYCASAILLAVSAFLFRAGLLNAVTQTLFWCVIFFLASAGAASTYLTVGEISRSSCEGRRSRCSSRSPARRWGGGAVPVRSPDR